MSCKVDGCMNVLRINIPLILSVRTTLIGSHSKRSSIWWIQAVNSLWHSVQYNMVFELWHRSMPCIVLLYLHSPSTQWGRNVSLFGRRKVYERFGHWLCSPLLSSMGLNVQRLVQPVTLTSIVFSAFSQRQISHYLSLRKTKHPDK